MKIAEKSVRAGRAIVPLPPVTRPQRDVQDHGNGRGQHRVQASSLRHKIFPELGPAFPGAS
jgi:hypothetical protein